ncbi:MAG: hypothetical protein HY986_19980 [Candidatus Melainabacteria bacterium]|nr:hypothetical protein [Candidatus Melainabacteria bacterium]
MFHLALAVFCFSLFMALFVFAFLFLLVWRFFHNRKKRRRLRLVSYQRRLKAIVAELLTDSNELDTASKYVGLDQDAKWVKSYQEALGKLLLSSERLNDCTTFLDAGELEASQECLLFVTRACYQVHRVFNAIRPEEKFVAMAPEAVKTEGSAPKDTVVPGVDSGKISEPEPTASDSEAGASTTEPDSGFVIKIKNKEIERKRSES